MRRLITFFLLFALGISVILQGCAVHEKKLQESGAKLLTQSELEQLFINKRIVEYSTNRGSGTITYFPDGTEKVKFGDVSDTGKYRIEKGQLCSKWENLGSGKENCYRFYKTGENKYEWVNLDGSFGGSMSFK